MPTIESIKKDIHSLGYADKEEILNYLEEVITFGAVSKEITKNIKESRFSKGKTCPYCSHEEISRYGRYNNKQRYLCKSCRKTFTDFTLSPKHNSRYDVDKWLKFAKCMINGYSIRETAAEVGINPTTAFFWRHKILDALRAYIGVGSVGGVIEVDELFFRESFKGNHKKSKVFKMPRTSRKRGLKGKNSSTVKRKRGISSELICVVCAKDRVGNIMTELTCKGRMSYTHLEKLFNDRIEKESILCTDSLGSYKTYANKHSVSLVQIKKDKFKEGIYHIQNINAFHSNLRAWMQKFKGVSTKYLANYLYWFKWLEFFKSEKRALKSKQLLIHAHSSHINVRIKDFQGRGPVYI